MGTTKQSGSGNGARRKARHRKIEAPPVPIELRDDFKRFDLSERQTVRDIFAVTGNLSECARRTGIPYGVIWHAYKRDSGGLDDWDEYGIWFRKDTREAVKKKFNSKVASNLFKITDLIRDRLEADDMGQFTSAAGELHRLVQTFGLLYDEPTDNIRLTGDSVYALFDKLDDDGKRKFIADLRERALRPVG